MAGLAALSPGAREALRTGHRTRVVRHARLAPASADDAAHMRFALEDALHTADFGDCGRLILVRRLRLLGLPRRASANVVAQALEEAWRTLAPQAVAHHDPDAHRAQAVYFTSRFAARLAWLVLRSAGTRTDAWFWPAAVPELAPTAAQTRAAGAIDAVVVALLQESASRTVQALRDWPATASLALAAELSDTTSALLLEAATTASQPAGAAPTGQRNHPPVAWSPDAVARAWPQVVARLLRHTPHHMPPLWLAAAWMSAAPIAAPNRAQVDALVAYVSMLSGVGGAVPASGPGGGPAPGDAHTRAAPAGPASATMAAAHDPAVRGSPDTALPRIDPPDAARPAGPGARLAMPSDLPSAAPMQPPAGRQPITGGLPWLDDALPTSHGGLLLIVNVLHALQFEAWFDRLPPCEQEPFANALPLHVLRQLHCAHDEPQLAWFDQPPAAMPWPLRAWTLRMRRFLRRHAGMDLDGLVRRPAWVSATATHADVVFGLEQTDLRLRRLGLDRDPGWVPWLGRIVSFHFLARERLPQPPGVPPHHG